MIWLCSDWHLNHNKEFIWKARGFESVAQMNEATFALALMPKQIKLLLSV